MTTGSHSPTKSTLCTAVSQSMKKVLRFRSKGPFQAWAAPSAADIHNISMFPTKRGIVGLIGCCMGIKKGSPKLAELSGMFDVLRCDRVIENDSPRPRRIADFQTARPLHKGDYFPKADGTKTYDKENAFAKIKYIACDSDFMIYLIGEEENMQKIYDAMWDPMWVPYLGRKSCFASEPILPEWVD